ncbi:MAG: hypothetical protein IJG37_06625 [Synergistaceae bacterium]|nr:hypothetical protein [Synergistaceae bacterium]MBQ6971480.1 hypothetical protein [Synergistaceae bacterium]
MPYEEEQELSLLDIFRIIWGRKWLIFFLTFVFGAGATIYAFTAPFIYRAECRVLPPGTGGGGLASQLGGLASFMGLGTASTASRGQTMLGILQGDSVVDVIIDKFNLMEELSIDIRLRARDAVLAKLEATEDTKSGIISVAYQDKDPQRAADIANAFVEQLQIKMREMSFLDAQEKRTFFENQLVQAQQQLADAENAMMRYQQNSGVLALGSQTASLLGSIAGLRNQIAAKNVEISSLSSYAREDNPRLKLARSQLEAMTKELHRLEEEQRRTERRPGRVMSGDILSSLGNVPELNVEYMRYERDLRFANVKYDTMLRQYENAKLSEASDLSTLQVIDPATPPDWKFKPKRAQIMVIGTMIGFCIGVFWAFLSAHIRSLKEGQEYYDE